jgi:hypothetical protein
MLKNVPTHVFAYPVSHSAAYSHATHSHHRLGLLLQDVMHIAMG